MYNDNSMFITSAIVQMKAILMANEDNIENLSDSDKKMMLALTDIILCLLVQKVEDEKNLGVFSLLLGTENKADDTIAKIDEIIENTKQLY